MTTDHSIKFTEAEHDHLVNLLNDLHDAIRFFDDHAVVKSPPGFTEPVRDAAENLHTLMMRKVLEP